VAAGEVVGAAVVRGAEATDVVVADAPVLPELPVPVPVLPVLVDPLVGAAEGLELQAAVARNKTASTHTRRRLFMS
jgi:hypothetical protein